MDGRSRTDVSGNGNCSMSSNKRKPIRLEDLKEEDYVKG